MTITKIETIRLEKMPMLLWVRIHTTEGLIGLGETFYGPLTVEAAVHELFAPLLVGRDPTTIESHWYNMFRLADHSGFGGAELRAISAIDTALWDVLGQKLGTPIYGLLGGACRDRIPVYDTYGGPDYYDNPLPYVNELLDRGITAMKVNAFPDGHLGDGYSISRQEIERTVAPIHRIVDAAGDRMRIAVDGHGFWSLHAAEVLARALEPYPILWIEELLSPRNLGAYKKLGNITSIPICLSERFLTRYQFSDFIEQGAMDIVMPDLVWTGGISETKKICTLAETHQLPVCPHDCTGPVNMFACAHICMSIPNAMLMESTRSYYEAPSSGPAWHKYPELGLTAGWYNEIVTTNVVIENGSLLAPKDPGLGTQLRPELLRRPDVRIRVSDEPAPHYFRWRQ